MTGSFKAQKQIAQECSVTISEVSSVIKKLKIVGFKRAGFNRSLYTPQQQSLIQAKLYLEGKCTFLTLESKMNGNTLQEITKRKVRTSRS